MARLAGALMFLRRYLARLSEEQWSKRGLHERRGEMTAAEILDRFVVSHLEEHADQLEKLAADSA
jgi:alkanesulfonate monooxygenase SsuD/methylene tetrahydromethanopterin reductase-like flavin-dependent oxidoreductase (luciferase family)